MGNSYRDVERMADKELLNKRKKQEIKMLEETIISLIEDPLKNGLTEEQMFLIRYYGLNEEDITQKNFDISNIEQIVYRKSEMPREQLEANRYEALMDIYSATVEFNEKEINKLNDCFHKDIREWDDFTRDFEQNPLMIKKMRNLQMLNRVAHNYEYIFKSILYGKNLQLNKICTDVDKKVLEYNVKKLFSRIKNDAKNAERKLLKYFEIGTINDLKNNRAIKYCINASRWLFKQKDEYITDILKDLQNTNGEYNYGEVEDCFVFEVPGYGQFAVHMGENNAEKIAFLKQLYSVKDYKGDLLGDVHILSKADTELLQSVNYDELDEIDKQRYRIASQKIEEKTIETKEDNKLDILMDGAKNKERAIEIIDVIRKAGLELEKVVTKTLLDRGHPDEIKNIIEIISKNGIGLDILTRCKTLLSVNTNKAKDIMKIIDKLSQLGIGINIIVESPNFLTVSKSEKLEPIYDVLKQYRIDLTNHNIAVAFEGTPQNIKRNMDLAIENGLYDLAQTGVIKFFTSNNKNLNMRINLLKKYNVPLVMENQGKRKINATLFKTEKDLMKMYGIDKKEILDELSKIKGQDLIQDSKYYVEENTGDIVLNEKQKAISKSIYEILKNNQLEENIVIKIGDYFYSAIKVREQIDNIIANLDIQDLENENPSEILKIALFSNKNIDPKEIDEVSEEIEKLSKENNQQVIKDVADEEIESSERTFSEELEDDEQKEKVNELAEKNAEYEEIREFTSNIVEKQENIESIEQIIRNLKKARKTLKYKINEAEDKINKKILENEESNPEVIQDIQNLKIIIKLQKEKRKEVKKMLKRYKENKKIMKSALKQEKRERDSVIDSIEL